MPRQIHSRKGFKNVHAGERTTVLYALGCEAKAYLHPVASLTEVAAFLGTSKSMADYLSTVALGKVVYRMRKLHGQHVREANDDSR